MTPPGYACDVQKEFTPERSVIGLGIGEFSTYIIYPAVGYSITIATGGTAAAAQTAAMIWWSAPHFPTDIIIGTALASVLSRSFFKTCKAFPLTCDRNQDDGVCEMRSGKRSTRASSNPMARLPMDGFKCAPTPADESGHSACHLQACSPEDLKENMHAGKLFGRTGIINGGTYNCANTKGTAQSLLGNLVSIPDPSFAGEVTNTVEARNALLQLYPHVSELTGLKSGSDDPQPECTEAALQEINQKYRITDARENGRFYVTCPEAVGTKDNQYEASCKSEDCGGEMWCLTDCGRFGPLSSCSPLPPVKCE
jgi:hypothetical protein